MDKVLEQIRDFADKAHGSQTRKYTPERYIVHPVRVMELCQRYTSDIPILAAALLHDVLEDTPVRKNQLHHFLSTVLNEPEAARTTQLVVELSDVYTKERFPRWNRRTRKTREAARIAQTSSDSQTVKYADIIDNCSEIVVQDPEFAGLFLLECRMLLQKIPKGDPVLYKQAIETVDTCLQKVPRKFRAYNA
jgi:(p)ppGpp synthase/HD superfamily hydrolase